MTAEELLKKQQEEEAARIAAQAEADRQAAEQASAQAAEQATAQASSALATPQKAPGKTGIVTMRPEGGGQAPTQEQSFALHQNQAVGATKFNIVKTGELTKLKPELEPYRASYAEKNKAGQLNLYGANDWGANEIKVDYTSIKDNKQAALFFSSLESDKDIMIAAKGYANATKQDVNKVIAEAEKYLSGTFNRELFSVPQTDGGKIRAANKALSGYGLLDYNGNTLDIYNSTPQQVIQSLHMDPDDDKHKDAFEAIKILQKTPGSAWYGMDLALSDLGYMDDKTLSKTEYNNEVKKFDTSFTRSQTTTGENAKAYCELLRDIQDDYGDNPRVYKQMKAALDKSFSERNGNVMPPPEGELDAWLTELEENGLAVRETDPETGKTGFKILDGVIDGVNGLFENLTEKTDDGAKDAVAKINEETDGQGKEYFGDRVTVGEDGKTIYHGAFNDVEIGTASRDGSGGGGAPVLTGGTVTVNGQEVQMSVPLASAGTMHGLTRNQLFPNAIQLPGTEEFGNPMGLDLSQYNKGEVQGPVQQRTQPQTTVDKLLDKDKPSVATNEYVANDPNMQDWQAAMNWQMGLVMSKENEGQISWMTENKGARDAYLTCKYGYIPTNVYADAEDMYSWQLTTDRKYGNRIANVMRSISNGSMSQEGMTIAALGVAQLIKDMETEMTMPGFDAGGKNAYAYLLAPGSEFEKKITALEEQIAGWKKAENEPGKEHAEEEKNQNENFLQSMLTGYGTPEIAASLALHEQENFSGLDAAFLDDETYMEYIGKMNSLYKDKHAYWSGDSECAQTVRALKGEKKSSKEYKAFMKLFREIGDQMMYGLSEDAYANGYDLDAWLKMAGIEGEEQIADLIFGEIERRGGLLANDPEAQAAVETISIGAANAGALGSEYAAINAVEGYTEGAKLILDEAMFTLNKNILMTDFEELYGRDYHRKARAYAYSLLNGTDLSEESKTELKIDLERSADIFDVLPYYVSDPGSLQGKLGSLMNEQQKELEDIEAIASFLPEEERRAFDVMVGATSTGAYMLANRAFSLMALPFAPGAAAAIGAGGAAFMSYADNFERYYYGKNAPRMISHMMAGVHMIEEAAINYSGSQSAVDELVGGKKFVDGLYAATQGKYGFSAFKAGAKYFGGQIVKGAPKMVGEAIGEAFEEVSDYGADALTEGAFDSVDKAIDAYEHGSDMATAVLDAVTETINGVDSEEVLQNIVDSFGAGAFMGGLFHVGGSAVNMVKSSASLARLRGVMGKCPSLKMAMDLYKGNIEPTDENLGKIYTQMKEDLKVPQFRAWLKSAGEAESEQAAMEIAFADNVGGEIRSEAAGLAAEAKDLTAKMDAAEAAMKEAEAYCTELEDQVMAGNLDLKTVMDDARTALSRTTQTYNELKDAARKKAEQAAAKMKEYIGVVKEHAKDIKLSETLSLLDKMYKERDGYAKVLDEQYRAEESEVQSEPQEEAEAEAETTGEEEAVSEEMTDEQLDAEILDVVGEKFEEAKSKGAEFLESLNERKNGLIKLVKERFNATYDNLMKYAEEDNDAAYEEAYAAYEKDKARLNELGEDPDAIAAEHETEIDEMAALDAMSDEEIDAEIDAVLAVESEAVSMPESDVPTETDEEAGMEVAEQADDENAPKSNTGSAPSRPESKKLKDEDTGAPGKMESGNASEAPAESDGETETNPKPVVDEATAKRKEQLIGTLRKRFEDLFSQQKQLESEGKTTEAAELQSAMDADAERLGKLGVNTDEVVSAAEAKYTSASNVAAPETASVPAATEVKPAKVKSSVTLENISKQMEAVQAEKDGIAPAVKKLKSERIYVDADQEKAILEATGEKTISAVNTKYGMQLRTNLAEGVAPLDGNLLAAINAAVANAVNAESETPAVEVVGLMQKYKNLGEQKKALSEQADTIKARQKAREKKRKERIKRVLDEKAAKEAAAKQQSSAPSNPNIDRMASAPAQGGTAQTAQTQTAPAQTENAKDAAVSTGEAAKVDEREVKTKRAMTKSKNVRKKLKSVSQTAKKLARKIGEGYVGGSRRMLDEPGSSSRGYHHNSKRTSVTRFDSSNDVQTAFHELGHAVQERLGIASTDRMIESWKQKFDAADAYKKNQYDHEAFAEFFWRWMKSDQEAIDYAGQEYIDAMVGAMKRKRIYKDVTRAKMELRELLEAPGDAKIGAMIVDAGTDVRDLSLNEKIGESVRNAIIAQVDYNYAGEAVNEVIRDITGENKVVLEHDVRAQGRLRDQALDRAGSFLTGRYLMDGDGNVIGDSLGHRLSEAGVKGKDFQDFIKYWVAVASLDRQTERKVKIGDKWITTEAYATINESVVPIAELEATITKLEDAHPEFKDAVAAIQSFNHDLMKAYMVDPGFMEASVLEVMEAMYPHYAPLRTAEIKPSGRYDAKRIKGSDADKINPMDTYVQMVNAIVLQEANNRVKLTLARAYDTYGKDWGEDGKGIGFFCREVTEDMAKKKSDSQEALTNAIAEAASNSKSESVYEDVVRAVTEHGSEVSSSGSDGNKNVIRVIDNGETRYFEVLDKPLLDMMSGNTNCATGLEQIGLLTRIMSALTTNVNAFFGLRNAPRDFQSSVNYGSWAATYIDGSAKWIASAIEVGYGMLTGKGEAWNEYSALGGGNATRLKSGTKKSNKQYRAEMFDGYEKANTGKFAYAGKKLSRAVTSINEVIEQTSRFAEYRYGKHDRTTAEGRKEAFLAAMDVTTDFNRRGSAQTAHVLKQVIPFYNASLQGIYRTARQFEAGEKDRAKTRLVKEIVNTGISCALFNMALMAALDDEEKEEFYHMSDDLKSKHIFFPNFAKDVFGDAPLLRVPIEQNPLATLINGAVTNAVWGKNTDNEFAIEVSAIAATIFTGFNPVGSTIADPIVSTNTNKNWYGSNIVPTYLQGLETPAQYTDETPEALVDLCGAMYEMSGGKVAISPMMAEYVLQQYTGVFGQTILPALSTNLATGKINGIDAIVEKARKTLTSDPLVSNNVVSRVYDNFKTLSSIEKTISAGKNEFKLKPSLSKRDIRRASEEAYELTHKGGELYDAKNEISALYDELEEIGMNADLSDKERYRMTSEVRREMIEVALEANEVMAEYEEKYMQINPLMRMYEKLFGMTEEE